MMYWHICDSRVHSLPYPSLFSHSFPFPPLPKAIRVLQAMLDIVADEGWLSASVQIVPNDRAGQMDQRKLASHATRHVYLRATLK